MRSVLAPSALLALPMALAACGGTVSTGQSGGTTGTGGTMTTSTPSASSGVGGGTVCGGFPGATCAADQLCDYHDGQCGGADGLGNCTLRPAACGKNYEPTCGCDQHVYDNPCLANQAGSDFSTLGGCTPPAGEFGCGAQFCALATSFCQVQANEGQPWTYACQPLPSACGIAPTCACLSSSPCSPTCAAGAQGGLTVICGTG